MNQTVAYSQVQIKVTSYKIVLNYIPLSAYVLPSHLMSETLWC